MSLPLFSVFYYILILINKNISKVIGQPHHINCQLNIKLGGDYKLRNMINLRVKIVIQNLGAKITQLINLCY